MEYLEIVEIVNYIYPSSENRKSLFITEANDFICKFKIIDYETRQKSIILQFHILDNPRLYYAFKNLHNAFLAEGGKAVKIKKICSVCKGEGFIIVPFSKGAHMTCYQCRGRGK